jgi:hypothetical protein
MILCRLDEGMSAEEATSVFDGFKRDFYQQEISASISVLILNADVLHRFLDDQFQAKLVALHGHFCRLFDDARLSHRTPIRKHWTDFLVLEMGEFKKMFCAMALNGQGIGTSALEEYQRKLLDVAEVDETAQMALEMIDAMDEDIEDVSGEFTHAEGTGLYSLHSKLNHSWYAFID